MKMKHYQELAYQVIENAADRQKLYQNIRDIYDCNFTMPDALQRLAWIKNRKFVSIAPKVALQGAVRSFATNLPHINIDPMDGTDKAWEISDRLERGVEWMYDHMNRRGEQSAQWKIIESAVLYCAVAFQTEYLPHALKGKVGPQYDELRRRGLFNWVVQPIEAVFPSWGKHGLNHVVLAYMRTVQDVIDEFGMDNPGVVKLMEQIRNIDPRAALRKTYVQFYDFADIEWRVIWMTLAGERQSFSNIIDDNPCILLKEKHGLGFIPWVVVDNREPILKALVDGDVWRNANILNTIQQSMFIALASHPRYWTNTATGKGVTVDFDDPNNTLDLKPGETAGVMDNPQIDPGLAAAVAAIDAQIYEASAPRVISSAEKLAEKGAAFSTINAIVQLSLAQLALSKVTAERAIEEGIYQMFRWIQHSGLPLFTRMARTTRGQSPMLAIVPGPLGTNASPAEVSFDLSELYITVELQSQTLIDESGRINNAIQKYEKLGVSQATAMEEVGINHPDHEQKVRRDEELRGIVPQGKQTSNFPAAQGIQTSKGGVTAQQYSPFQGREQITSTTSSGDAVA